MDKADALSYCLPKIAAVSVGRYFCPKTERNGLQVPYRAVNVIHGAVAYSMTGLSRGAYTAGVHRYDIEQFCARRRPCWSVYGGEKESDVSGLLVARR